jgi:hypothetical protein
MNCLLATTREPTRPQKLMQHLFTDKDKAWEVNFNTQYRMYENLAAILELGYMKADLKKDETQTSTFAKDDAAWKAAAGFRFRF